MIFFDGLPKVKGKDNKGKVTGTCFFFRLKGIDGEIIGKIRDSPPKNAPFPCQESQENSATLLGTYKAIRFVVGKRRKSGFP